MSRLTLHVGLPKSGTTYVQRRLVRNAEALLSAGALVPMAPPEDGPGSAAFRAALELTDRRMGRPRAYVAGRWITLVRGVSDHPGPVVISHEALARCSTEQAARAVADLGTRHEVHVVLTARDPARLLISAWLEGLKHGTTHDYEEHVRSARFGELSVWRTLDLPAVASVWAGVLPPGRLHVVTVPPRGASRDALWPRFCAVAHLPSDQAPRLPRRANESLGVPEAQLLLAVNRLLGEDVARGGRHHHRVARVVAPRLARSSTVAVGPSPEVTRWAEPLAREWLAWLDEHDVDVVGDRADLVPAAVDLATWVDPAVPHPGVARAAADVVQALLEGQEGSGSQETVLPGGAPNPVDGGPTGLAG